MDKPAILSNPEAFVVVPVHGTTTMHEAWYRARDTIVGGYYADKGPYEALLDARPDPTALADIVAYCAALEAENARLMASEGIDLLQRYTPKDYKQGLCEDPEGEYLNRFDVVAALRAERDAAYRNGAEDMLERAAVEIETRDGTIPDRQEIAAAIRKLEVKE